MKNVKFLVVFALLLFIPIVKLMAWNAAGTPLSYDTFVTGDDNYGQIAIDTNNNVYVAGENSSLSVAKYDSSGNYLYSIGPTASFGVAIAPDTSVYVTNWNATIGSVPGVYKYDSSGNSIDISSTDLGGTTIFAFSYGIAVDDASNVYVSDITNNLVYKFNSAGSLINTISGNGTSFNSPQSVATDDANNLYVLDSGNNRVQKFDSSGTFIAQLIGNGGAWSYPEDFTVDGDGNVYVADSGNNRIQIFDPSGTFQQELDQADFGLGAFSYLVGMAIAPDGVLYVGDYNIRIITATFDQTYPTVTVDSLTGDETTDTTPTLTGSASDSITAITTVEYSVDSGAWTACIADDGIFDELSETYSCTVSPALTAGSHSIDVRATDSKGNTNSGATVVNYPFDIVAVVVDSGSSSSSSSSSNSSGSSDSSGGTVCNPLPSGVSPNIFSIVRIGATANIYYSPISSDAAGYQLMYGHASGDGRFGATFKTDSSTGAQQYVVNGLEANRKYYFWMRGVSDCSQPGPWSSIYESAVTDSYYSSAGEDFLNSDLDNTASGSGESNDGSSSSELSDSSESSESAGNNENNGSTGVNGINLNDQRLTDIKNTVANLLGKPLSEELSRQIMMPVDASYVVKVGAVGVVANMVVASAITFLTLSKTIFSSLSAVYKASSRSMLKMPSDYISSLINYSFMGFTSTFSPFIPSDGKNKNRNGVVFDAFSFKPLAKVFVILFSESGNLKIDFSDQQGKYKFQDLTPDDYQMRAEIAGYKFPS